MAKWIVIYVLCMLCCNVSPAQLNGRYTLPFSSAGSIRDMMAMPDSGYCVTSAYKSLNPTPPSVDSSNLIRFDKFNAPVWSRSYYNYVIKSITPTVDGDILTAGYTKSAGSPFPYLSVQKMDGSGNNIWRKFLVNDPVFETPVALNYFLKVIELSDKRIVVINGYDGFPNAQTITLLDRLGNLVKSVRMNGQAVDVMEGFNNTIIVLFQLTVGNINQGPFTHSGILQFDFSLNLLQAKNYRTNGGVTFFQCFKDVPSNSYYLCGAYSASAIFWQGETMIIKVLPSLAATPIQSVRWRKKYRTCQSSLYRFAKSNDGIVAIESGVTSTAGYTPLLTEPSFDNTITKWRATNLAFDGNLILQWAKRQVIGSFNPTVITNPAQGYIITQILRLPNRIVYAGNNDFVTGKAAFLYQVDTLGGTGNCVSTPNPILADNNVTVTLADTAIRFTRYVPVFRSASMIQSNGKAIIAYQCVQKQKPVSKFSFYQQPQYGNFPDVVCQRSSVTFLDSSWHEPETWQWIFPPQADLSAADDTSCYPNIYNVQFTQTGTFPVKLVTTNDTGTDTLTKYITVINFIPQPALGRDTTVCPGDSVRLIHNSVPNSTHYFYRVGGGFYSTNDTVFVRLSGTYVCVATSACGVKSDTVKISIAARPAAAFSYAINCDSFRVRFRDLSNGNGSTSLQYQWRFLDKNNVVLGTSVLQSPVFTYPGTDTFKAVLIVRSTFSCVQPDTVTKTIIITAKPVATFTYTNSCGSRSALFTNISTVATGSVQSSTWLLGDGNASIALNPVYTYSSFGTYTVRLVVTNAGGCDSDTAIQTVIIKAKPVARIAYDTNTCATSPTLLRDSSMVEASTIQSYWWQAQGQTFTQANIQQLFATGGSYTLLHAVTSVQGCASDTLSQNIFIESFPVASFATPAQSGCAGETLFFSALATITYGQIAAGRWRVNNGPYTTVNGSAGFSYLFAQPGNYTVSYQPISSHGCMGNTATQTVSIGSIPVANFSFDSFRCTGKPVSFINSSTNAGSAVSNSLWAVGSSTPVPVTGTGNYSYTFAQRGAYPVRLQVITAQGCSSSVVKTVSVISPPASAGPDVVVRAGEPFLLQGYGGISYLWQPPTGLSSDTAQRPSGILSSSQQYTLQITTAQGCTGSDAVNVMVQQKPIIPTAFSPNGDGINDSWQIAALTTYPQAVVEVYDRYGQLVHTARGSSSTVWDGKRNGQPVAVGTYYYILTLNSVLGDKPLNGWVMVVR